MKRSGTGRLTVIMITMVLLIAACFSCGCSSGTELSDDDTFFKGIHIRLPKALKEESAGGNEAQYSSKNSRVVFAVENSENYRNGYDAWEAHILYSKSLYDKPGTDISRISIGGIDALIEKKHGHISHAVMILRSNAVSISFYSDDKEMLESFDEALLSVKIDSDEIPEINRFTSPEALKEESFKEKPTYAEGLYIYLPRTFRPADINDFMSWEDPPSYARIQIMKVPDKITEKEDKWWIRTIKADPLGGNNYGTVTLKKLTINGMDAAKVEFSINADRPDGRACTYIGIDMPRSKNGSVLIKFTKLLDKSRDVDFGQVIRTLRFEDGWIDAEEFKPEIFITECQ